MNLESMRRDDWIIGGVALLLVIDLLFFPWFSFSFGPFSVTTTATGSFDGWTAIIAVIALFALLADLGVERLSPQTQLPTIGGSGVMTRFVLALVAAGFIVLKFLLHIHFSYFDFGFYLGVVLTAVLVYFALQARNAPVVATSRPAAGPPPTGPPPA